MSLLSYLGSSVPFEPASGIPSLKGKAILVTGGNSGLGKQCVLEYARHEPEQIWLAARDAAKASAAIDDIKKEVPAANIRRLDLDLASLDSVKQAAKTVLAESARLDILMANAGIMITPAGVTKDGYEIQFGTCHMGHALLIKLLTPLLLKTADLPGADVRVIVLSSMGAMRAPSGGIRFDTLKTDGSAITSTTRYGQAKLANALFARQLAKERPQLTVASVHPGLVGTNLGHYISEQNFVLRGAMALLSKFVASVESGARNQLWASVSEDVASGEYYTPVGVIGSRPAVVRDDALAKKLWDWTEEELRGYTV